MCKFSYPLYLAPRYAFSLNLIWTECKGVNCWSWFRSSQFNQGSEVWDSQIWLKLSGHNALTCTRSYSTFNASTDVGWNNSCHRVWNYFACTRKGVHLYSLSCSPGKM